MKFIINDLNVEAVRFDIANVFCKQLEDQYWFALTYYKLWAMHLTNEERDEGLIALDAIQAQVQEGDIGKGISRFWPYVWAYFQKLPEEKVLEYFSYFYDKQYNGVEAGDEFDWRYDNGHWVIRNISYF